MDPGAPCPFRERARRFWHKSGHTRKQENELLDEGANPTFPDSKKPDRGEGELDNGERAG